MKLDVIWAEQQHLNYLISIIEKVASAKNSDGGKRKLSNSELAQYIV